MARLVIVSNRVPIPKARGAQAGGLAVALRDLLRLRREDPVFHDQRAGRLDGAVLGAEAFVLRYFGDDGDDRLLLVNFGPDLELSPAPEPLLSTSPIDRPWRTNPSAKSAARSRPSYAPKACALPSWTSHWDRCRSRSPRAFGNTCGRLKS